MANKLIQGVNDFETWCKNSNSQLLDEWDYSKNVVSPSSVCYGSSKKVYWVGKSCGHSFIASLNKRTSDGTGCPYCSRFHSKLLVGFNDLATTNPDIAKLWDFEKNGDLKPCDVMKGQHDKVYWKGDCGHSWKASIYHVVGGRKCPICNKESKTSFPEQAIYYFVKKYYPDAINGDRHLGKELDIFIPSLNTAIEYDGQRWHGDIQKDEAKNELCHEHGIKLIRVRERECWFWSENENLILVPCESNNDLELTNAILNIFIFLQGPIFVDIDINAAKPYIYEQYITAKKANSLLEVNPVLASEWNICRNGDLTPAMVTASSGKKVWWIGACGHEWEATVASRNNTASGCPYCNGNRLLPGENDLQTANPLFLQEWDYSKNSKRPCEYTRFSKEKIFWKCKICNHSFYTSISNRSRGSGCPQCVRQRVKEKYKNKEIIPRKPISRSDNSAHRKKVINKDTGEIFESLVDAGLKYSIASNKISEVCSGKRKTAGKFHWAYFEEN